MSKPEEKLIQYLMEARASEHALLRVLQSQIVMTPRGAYRSALEQHLEETRGHARRVGERLRALDVGSSPVNLVVGLWEDVLGQAVALGKAPFDLLRGSSGEEKVLKNAKDTCATESLEIATYTAIARLARRLDDRATAELAAEILSDERRMLARVMEELPRLVDGVIGAELESARPGADADEDELPLAGYDELTVEQITQRLSGLSQTDLATIDAYEREGQNRTTILDRIGSLRGQEPWPGYDGQTVADVQARLADADEDRLRTVREYERSHKNRTGVLRTTERRLTA